MINFKLLLSRFWASIEHVVELTIYIALAKILQKTVQITFIQSITILFSFFLLNLLRIYIELIRRTYPRR